MRPVTSRPARRLARLVIPVVVGLVAAVLSVVPASAATTFTTTLVNNENGACATVSTPSTGGWDTIGSVTVTLTLVSGANTISIGNTTGWAPDIDRIVVS